MVFVLLVLVLLVAVSAAVAVLISAGFRAGDHPGDARISMAGTWIRQPDGWVAAAQVSVANPGEQAAVATISARPAHRWERSGAAGLVSGGNLARRLRRAATLDHTTILADGGTRASAQILLPAGPLARARVTVVVDQAGGRLRVWRGCLPVPASTPVTAPSSRTPTEVADR